MKGKLQRSNNEYKTTVEPIDYRDADGGIGEREFCQCQRNYERQSAGL